jgi:uncharacterized protein (TIGR03435 family)
MFDRLSSRALRVVFHARGEVSRLGSSTVEPEHILLGLLEEGQGLASRILARTLGPLEHVRTEVVDRLAKGEPVPESVEIPFSASCVRVLQSAAEEADRLAHAAVGTEHLLLGLLREGRGAAAKVLAAGGLRLDAVREAVVERRRDDEPPEPPGPPPSPANTYRWPVIPFVPSPTVHILYSGMRPPQPPVINHALNVFSAYGYTLEEAIVRAWEGSRWHVDITPGLGDDTRFDFLMILPQEEATAACLGRLRSAIEQHFAVEVTQETRRRDVYVVTHTGTRGDMLRRYPEPEPGWGCALVPFSVFRRRPPDAPMFPLDPFSVHSVPFFLLVQWFEEILRGQVVDETGLPGIYGFELKARVDTPDAFIRLLRDEAGLAVTRQQRETPTLVVRRRDAGADRA